MIKCFSYFFLFLTLPAIAQAKELCVCAIFRDEAPYLKEWIDFHLEQGVEHFYLYNNCSKDEFAGVLVPYIAQKVVTLIDWSKEYPDGQIAAWNAIQCGAYNHCLDKFGHKWHWMAFIDIDEFAFCTRGKKLSQFLKNFTDYAALCIHWQMFGTSNIWDLPPGALIMEHLTRCALPDHPVNTHVKSIVQPRYVTHCNNPHFCRYLNGMYGVNENFDRVEKAFSSPVSVKKVRINHYWSRTMKYFLNHKIPGHVKMCGANPDDMIAFETELNLTSFAP